jgi:ribosomal protein L9
MAKKAEVLLLKPLQGKGNAGDIVEVKTHYANYVLIPKGIAVYNTKQIKNQRAAFNKKVNAFKVTMKKSVEEMITALKESGFTFSRAANDAGSMYDSISTRTFTQYASENFGLTLNTENFTITEGKIDQLGEYEVEFTYEDINVMLPVKVIRAS